MKRINLVLFAFIIAILTACGGGDGGYGNQGNNTNNENNDTGENEVVIGDLAISLVLLNQAGQPTDSVSSAEPGVLRATVTFNSAPLTSTVVTFNTTLGDLDPVSGTALTNASGIATINLVHGGSDGAGNATASVAAGGQTAEASDAFSLTTAVVTTTIDMGNGTGINFTPDVVSTGGITNLSAGGSLTASINIVETTNSNLPYNTPVNVTFTSNCVGTSDATMDNPVLTANGAASSVYTASGCVGNDTITASADIGGTTYSASATINVQPATVGSIQFNSATNEIIAIQGTGGSGLSETSTVTFTVFDQFGDPLAGQDVNFDLSTTVGAITLNPVTATTNALGQVQTTVTSGTVSTPVIVTATVAATTISTSSVALAVSTGRPDNDSFSVSAEVLNPPVWECDGGIVPITVRASDHFNNPAPDGTSISFRAEGGSIGPNCTTIDGSCTVNWESSEPRPADGRVTILATAIGEESYTDSNPSNGRFDDGEAYTDLPEAWLDNNEDGVRDINEEYVDFNSNSQYDSISTSYNGVLCATGSTQCDQGVLLNVRDSITLVMASVNPTFRLYDTTGATDVEVTNGIINLLPSIARSYRVDIQDIRGQRPPAGSTISVSTNNGTLMGGTSTDVPSTNLPGPASFGFIISGDTTPNQGALSISVNVPGTHCQGGLETTVGLIVSDIPPP